MFCPNCGKQIPYGSKFCPYCGANLTTESIPAKEKQVRKKNLLLVLIPIIVVVIALSIFIFLKFFSRVNPEASVQHNNKGMSIAEEITKEDQESVKKNVPAMVSEFKKAVKLDPDNISARKNLVYAYLFTGDLKDAQNETEGLLKIDPQNDFAIKLKELLTEEGE
jgi:uncharacterized membrane protein YvbJ